MRASRFYPAHRTKAACARNDYQKGQNTNGEVWKHHYESSFANHLIDQITANARGVTDKIWFKHQQQPYELSKK